MTDNIERIREKSRSDIENCADLKALEKIRVQYLGKKGEITSLLHSLGKLDPNQRRQHGQSLNALKLELETAFEHRRSEFERKSMDAELAQAEPIDVTLPGQYAVQRGTIHPVNRVIDEMLYAFRKVGFSIASGPEVENEFFNFEALNTPQDHPARDEQDTFYLSDTTLLRSHTSPVQIRAMKERTPPIQIVSFGKVYRSDYDQTHTPMFHQMEGLMVDKTISFADLKGILYYLVKTLFGARKLRFRPSFFPFTEPSAEVDMQCIVCSEPGRECRLCCGTGWIEIGGCGMVHPNVLKAVDYDAEKFSGFAFGMGVERIAMLMFGICDLRSFFENDYRMLEQF